MNRVIACAGIKPELEYVRDGDPNVQVQYLPQHLHRSPHELRKFLQEAIDQIENEDEKLILGYGLCSNSVVGLQAPSQGLYVPRVHDCITFYLGSREKYRELFGHQPGTYYLTSGWVHNHIDPLGLMEHEYTKRVGKKMAGETIRRELKHYRQISYIHTAGSQKKGLERARQNAEYFKKEFVEHKGSDEFFRKILFGPHETPDFIYVKPNEKVTQQEFFK